MTDRVDLCLNMLSMQMIYDALRSIRFVQNVMKALAGEMAFAQQMAHAGNGTSV